MTGEPHRYEKPSRKHRKSEFKGWNGLRALTARFSVWHSGEPHRNEKSSRFFVTFTPESEGVGCA